MGIKPFKYMYCLLKTLPFHGQCVGIQIMISCGHLLLTICGGSIHYALKYTLLAIANIRNIYFTTRKVPGHRQVWVQIVKIFWNCSFNYIWLNIQKELWSVCIVHIWAYHRENIIIGFNSHLFFTGNSTTTTSGESGLLWSALGCNGLPWTALHGLSWANPAVRGLP